MAGSSTLRSFNKFLVGIKYTFINIIISMGYKNVSDWIMKFFVPISFLSFVVLGTIYFISLFPRWMIIVGFIIYLGFVFGYPIFIYLGKIGNIKSHMFFFITYVSSLSTLQISRTLIFKRVAQNRRFGYLSDIASRLIYFSKSWNLGFSKSARIVKEFIPYKPLFNFFERLATISDFGEDVETFFLEEQSSFIDEVVYEYNKTFENIKMIQELFISFVITFAFVISIGMLIPILSGSSLNGFVKLMVIVVVSADIILIAIIKMIVPKDDLLHNLPISRDLSKMVNLSFFLSAIFSAFLIFYLSFKFLPRLPFLVVIAIGLTPMAIPAYLATQLEEKIIVKDESFPPFIRTLGGALESKGGGMLSTLEELRTNDFGPLQSIFIGLYKRLKIGSDKYQAWLYFGAESDSNLIYNFSQIFAETSYLGGNSSKISEVISTNFQKILALRKRKFQLVSALRGSLYGSLVGFASAAYISLEITSRLASTFALPMQVMQESGGSFMSGLFPHVPKINYFMVSTLVGMLIVLHSFFSAYSLKLLDGGHKFALFFDALIMIWIGAIMSWVIPFTIEKLLPSVTSTASSLFSSI